MTPLTADLLALGVLAALLLLPGLAVVAAPWPAAPFLSLAFWLASWSWALALGGSRETFVRLALASFAALAALRLLKPLTLGRPAAASAVVLLLALGALLSFRAQPLATHPSASEQALAARLLVARDGWPVTRAPFEPERSFARVGGLSLLAADVALLSGAPVWRGTLLVGLAAPGLLAVALLFLVRRVERAASAGASPALLLGLVLLGRAGLDPGLVLAAACGVVGLGLLARGTTRAPAVAAGASLAAAGIFHPGVGFVALALVVPVVLAGLRVPAGARGAPLRARLLVAALAWAAFLGPALLRLGPVTWRAGAASWLGLGLAGLATVWLATATATRSRLALGASAVLATAGLAFGIAQARASQPLGDDTLRALICLRPWGAPTDALCVGSAALAKWAPSLSDHAAHVEPPGRPCRFRLAPAGPLPGAPVCAAGSVQIVEGR